MKKTYLILLSSLIFSFNAFAQIERNLPNACTPLEEKGILEYAQGAPSRASGITNPPNFPIRTAAEWEEIQALCITWRSFPTVLSQIVKEAQSECKVIIICTDSLVVKSNLASNGVVPTNVVFLQQQSNTIWMRDYGGNTVYKNDVEDLLLVDWIYNRPRPKDDVIPEAIATYYNIPIYSTTTVPNDLVHTGGNFMSDGMGTAFSSKLVLNENKGTGYSLVNKTEAQIDTIMHNFMGIQYGRYIKMETLPYDGIHHIDMHMKLLDENTLLVGKYPTGIADGPQIEANLQYVLNNYNTPFGVPYKVVRVQMPPENNAYPNTTGEYRTYTNWVFVNKKILIPVYEEEYDTTALNILQESLPGYQIVPIPCNDIIQQSGAIHCITHCVGVNQPLLITHQPLEDTYNTSIPYIVTASLQHQTGIDSAILWYRTQNIASFQSVSMTNAGGNTFSVGIPPQIAGTVVEYYIEGKATNGKEQVRPITAPSGYYHFEVLHPVSIEKNSISEMQSIFPNPASALTCIPLNLAKSAQGSLKIYNLVGQELGDIHTGNFPTGESKYFFNAANYSSGTYFVMFKTNECLNVQKVIVR